MGPEQVVVLWMKGWIWEIWEGEGNFSIRYLKKVCWLKFWVWKEILHLGIICQIGKNLTAGHLYLDVPRTPCPRHLQNRNDYVSLDLPFSCLTDDTVTCLQLPEAGESSSVLSSFQSVPKYYKFHLLNSLLRSSPSLYLVAVLWFRALWCSPRTVANSLLSDLYTAAGDVFLIRFVILAFPVLPLARALCGVQHQQ